MDLTVWRAFVTVCRAGSLSAAAAELNHTQSAVSRQIAGLERSLGVSLVERHARGVRPTPAGEAFRRHALATLNEADRAVRAVQAIRDGVGGRPLAIGATPSLAAGIVPEAVRALLERAGSIHWSLLPAVSAQLHSRVVAGDLDIAVVTDAPPGLTVGPTVDRRFLGLDEMVVVLPSDHPQAGQGKVHIQALADQTWVEDNDGSATLLRQHAARAGVSARIDLTAADLPGKLALVATGHAIALIPRVLTRALRADVTTVTLVNPPTRGIYTITPRRDPHPCSAPLRDLLAAAIDATRPAPAAHRSGATDGHAGAPMLHHDISDS
ncbi:LysR family transcriptional regulator [Streptomyces sp. NPDC047841]|uniref:LysR family transcriptional regulator n=1 Tax=Streptomyces sp. NPDC047841 TaxID=3154708 RepID=UPI0034523B67